MSDNLVYVDLVETPGAEQPWRSRVSSGDNDKVLFVSSEAYHNRADAVHAAQLAFGPTANVFLREDGHAPWPLRQSANQSWPDEKR